MIYIAALLLAPWLHRVTRASLNDRVHRLEVGFWLVVISLTMLFLTAGAVQWFQGLADLAAPLGPGPGRA